MAKKVKASPVHLVYWCKTSVIDEIVCKKRGLAFSRELAQKLEARERHYFIVDKKGNYTVIPGEELERYFNNREAPVREITPEIQLVVDRAIKETHGV